MVNHTVVNNKNKQAKPSSPLITQALLLTMILMLVVFAFAHKLQNGLDRYDLGEVEPHVSHFVSFAAHSQVRFRDGLEQLDDHGLSLFSKAKQAAAPYAQKLKDMTNDFLEDFT